jgi:hypothetical protein
MTAAEWLVRARAVLKEDFASKWMRNVTGGCLLVMSFIIVIGYSRGDQSRYIAESVALAVLATVSTVLLTVLNRRVLHRSFVVDAVVVLISLATAAISVYLLFKMHWMYFSN